MIRLSDFFFIQTRFQIYEKGLEKFFLWFTRQWFAVPNFRLSDNYIFRFYFIIRRINLKILKPGIEAVSLENTILEFSMTLHSAIVSIKLNYILNKHCEQTGKQRGRGGLELRRRVEATSDAAQRDWRGRNETVA